MEVFNQYIFDQFPVLPQQVQALVHCKPYDQYQVQY